MTEQQRKAMQQALDALASCSGVPHWPALQPTITALRAALAEPQTVNEAHEACELLKRMGFKWYELENSWYPSAPAKPEPEPERNREWHDGLLEGRLRERQYWLAQPEPEPVAWMRPDNRVAEESYSRTQFSRGRDKPPIGTWTPLYTTPPARRACWCATCDKAEHILPTRMSVCPRCGDKRCPRADFHGNECREEGGNDE